MKTPGQIHDFSTRPFPERIPNFYYDSDMKVMKVCKNGSMRWKSYYWVYLTASLSGKYVGAREVGNGVWRVYYRDVFLGFFNEKDIRNKEMIIRLSQNLV